MAAPTRISGQPASRSLTSTAATEYGDVGDDVVSRAKPGRAHVQIVGAVAEKQEEADAVAEQNESADYCHCLCSGNDARDRLVDRFDQNARAEQRHDDCCAPP